MRLCGKCAAFWRENWSEIVWRERKLAEMDVAILLQTTENKLKSCEQYQWKQGERRGIMETT
jgi:hypothetical protein